MKRNTFSFFSAPVSNVVPSYEVEISDIFRYLTGTRGMSATRQVRDFSTYYRLAGVCATESGDKRALERLSERIRELKSSQFDYATFSVLCTRRSCESVVGFSGLICLDFDHLPNAYIALGEIIETREPELAFISPSGDGVKCIYKYADFKSAEELSLEEAKKAHRVAYEELKSDFTQRELFSSFLDPTSADIMRACFLPSGVLAYKKPEQKGEEK